MDVKKKSFWEFLLSPLGKAALIIVLYFVIMGLALLILTVFENTPIVAVIFAIIFGYFGWQALNKITPDIFLIMPVAGWIAFFVVKGLLSFFIGVFVAPFVISKKIVKKISDSV